MGPTSCYYKSHRVNWPLDLLHPDYRKERSKRERGHRFGVWRHSATKKNGVRANGGDFPRTRAHRALQCANIQAFCFSRQSLLVFTQKINGFIVYKPNTDSGRFPKLASTKCFLVFSTVFKGALYKYACRGNHSRGWYIIRGCPAS